MSMNKIYCGAAGYALSCLNFENGVIAFSHSTGLVMSRMRQSLE